MTPNDITNALRSREPIAALRAARGRDDIVGWLEQQPGAEDALAAINAGYPADEVVRDFAPDYDTRWEEGAMAGGHVWPYDPKSCPGFRAQRDTDPCLNCGGTYGSHGTIILDNGTIEGVTPPAGELVDDEVSVCDECGHAGADHTPDLDHPTCWSESRCRVCAADMQVASAEADDTFPTCPRCGAQFKVAMDHAASTGHYPDLSADEDDMVAMANEVRERWDAFLESYQRLFAAFRGSSDPRHQQEAYRIDAYQPGGDPGRDWGMGMSATTWFDEFDDVIANEAGR